MSFKEGIGLIGNRFGPNTSLQRTLTLGVRSTELGPLGRDVSFMQRREER